MLFPLGSNIPAVITELFECGNIDLAEIGTVNTITICYLEDETDE